MTIIFILLNLILGTYKRDIFGALILLPFTIFCDYTIFLLLTK